MPYITTFHYNITGRSQPRSHFFRWQGIGPARTWRGDATANQMSFPLLQATACATRLSNVFAVVNFTNRKKPLQGTVVTGVRGVSAVDSVSRICMPMAYTGPHVFQSSCVIFLGRRLTCYGPPSNTILSTSFNFAIVF